MAALVTNRDRPASTLTKREHAALLMLVHNERMRPDVAILLADSLFDLLDTPAELRDGLDGADAWSDTLTSVEKAIRRYDERTTP